MPRTRDVEGERAARFPPGKSPHRSASEASELLPPLPLAGVAAVGGRWRLPRCVFAWITARKRPCGAPWRGAEPTAEFAATDLAAVEFAAAAHSCAPVAALPTHIQDGVASLHSSASVAARAKTAPSPAPAA